MPKNDQSHVIRPVPMKFAIAFVSILFACLLFSSAIADIQMQNRALGEVMGDAMDPKREIPVPGLSIQLFDINDTPMDIATTDADGKFAFGNLDLGDYYLVVDDPAYRYLKLNFEITSDASIQLPPVWCVPEPLVLNGDTRGSVIDVLSGDHLNAVDLEFRKGIDPPDSEPVIYTTQTSGGLGNYYFDALDLEAGVYTASAAKSGYRDDYFHIFILGGEHVEPQNGALSPIIQGDDMRIVLTWGILPDDLDSHLWAPDPFGAGKVHLYYDVLNSHPWGSYFDLDLDDQQQYGPETTTIHQWEPGTYCFFVHDYTFQFLPVSIFLSYSSARVAVLTATDTHVFYVTPNSIGTGWFVFTVDGATREVTPVNTYSWDPTPEVVGLECQFM